MISVEVIVPTDVFEAIAETAQKSPRLMQTAYDRAVRGLRRQIVDELSRAPGKPHYPIRWATQRQRRAFFASNGFGRGIPTARTGALEQGWKTSLDTTEDGGVFTVFNDVPYARFVQGDDAQPFHLETGWSQAAPILSKYRELAEERLIQVWFTVTDPSAGVSP